MAPSPSDPPPAARDRARKNDARTLGPIIVVGYRNAADIAQCVKSLRKANRGVPFSIFISENGGPEVFDADFPALKADPPIPKIESCNADATFARTATFSWATPPLDLTLAEMRSNLGYAGGVNAWIDRLIDNDVWLGFWVLNPDTFPLPTRSNNSCFMPKPTGSAWSAAGFSATAIRLASCRAA